MRSGQADFRDLLSRSPRSRSGKPSFRQTPLSLRLQPCDVLPLGRPGRTEPDFLIYPSSKAAVPTRGLVELKTHSIHVATVTRRNVLSLTRDAATAMGRSLHSILGPGQRILWNGRPQHPLLY